MKEINNLQTQILPINFSDHSLNPSQLKLLKISNFCLTQIDLLKISGIEHLVLNNCSIQLSKLQFFDFITTFKHFQFLNQLEIVNTTFSNFNLPDTKKYLKNKISHLNLDINIQEDLLYLILEKFNSFTLISLNTDNQISMNRITKCFPYLQVFNGYAVRNVFKPPHFIIINQLYQQLQNSSKRSKLTIQTLEKEIQLLKTIPQQPQLLAQNIAESFIDFQSKKSDQTTQTTLKQHYQASESNFDGLNLFDLRLHEDCDKQTEVQFLGQNQSIQAEFSGNIDISRIADKVLNRSSLSIARVVKVEFEEEGVDLEQKIVEQDIVIEKLKIDNLKLSQIDRSIMESVGQIEKSSVLKDSRTVIDEIEKLISELEQ